MCSGGDRIPPFAVSAGRGNKAGEGMEEGGLPEKVTSRQGPERDAVCRAPGVSGQPRPGRRDQRAQSSEGAGRLCLDHREEGGRKEGPMEHRGTCKTFKPGGCPDQLPTTFLSLK